jgi:isopentenyl-diphosphate delta-isomerase
MENEICPVVVGVVEDEPIVHPDEVAATRWVPWHTFIADIEQDPGRFSEWCIEEARIIATTAIGRQLIGA